MVELVLHLGSNMGNPEAMLQSCIILLEREFGNYLRKSKLYKSAAWGVTDQQDFLNQALVFLTQRSPIECLETVKQIEKELGRMPRARWTEREIDIDIIFYGSKIVKRRNLEIPHKEIANRMFVLKPLSEIIPNFIHPVLGLTVRQLSENTHDELEVEIWKKN